MTIQMHHTNESTRTSLPELCSYERLGENEGPNTDLHVWLRNLHFYELRDLKCYFVLFWILHTDTYLCHSPSLLSSSPRPSLPGSLSLPPSPPLTPQCLCEFWGGGDISCDTFLSFDLHSATQAQIIVSFSKVYKHDDGLITRLIPMQWTLHES